MPSQSAKRFRSTTVQRTDALISEWLNENVKPHERVVNIDRYAKVGDGSPAFIWQVTIEDLRVLDKQM